MADQLRDWLVQQYPGKSESPMESLLLAGFEMVRPRLMLPPEVFLTVAQQAPVGKYRADFLFSLKDSEGKQKRLVVEVDGHEFHERTKKQAAHDKSRDRWMTGEGYELMRFTGSEVWANPFRCGLDIGDRLYRMRFGTSRREANVRAGIAAILAMLETN